MNMGSCYTAVVKRQSQFCNVIFTITSKRGAMNSDLTWYAARINEAWNSHNIEKVLDFYAPEYIGEDIAQVSPQHGQQALRTVLENCWRAFPDLQFSVISSLVEGSHIAILWLGEGTHQGTFMNIPPTGRRLEVRGVSMIDVKDGLIQRGQYVWDLAGMLRHMGLLPELGPAENVQE
jgi:steroid delta-isomerase-like uncharacterized protein